TLEAMLPSGTTILGLDEHTVCILDFSSRVAIVEGLGQITIRRHGVEQRYSHGEKIAFEHLLGDSAAPLTVAMAGPVLSPSSSEIAAEPDALFWDRMHNIEKAFHNSLEQYDLAAMTTLLLEADRLLWQTQIDQENNEFVSQGRELYREMLVLTGIGIDKVAADFPRKIKELVNKLIELRAQYRREKRWSEADQIRSLLQSAGVTLEDTDGGPSWHL
ncbi:MAG TPA: hypothetical protein VLH18_07920, partial [Candidatus Limnocylindrales bacterium]|nr:hypothetical protein [Candidatus Limnocylindrales bacterium]